MFPISPESAIINNQPIKEGSLGVPGEVSNETFNIWTEANKESVIQDTLNVNRNSSLIELQAAAKKEGILPGGGAALCYVASLSKLTGANEGEDVGIRIMRNSLHSPFVRILKNAGLNPSEYEVEGWGYGVDVIDAVFVGVGVIADVLVIEGVTECVGVLDCVCVIV